MDNVVLTPHTASATEEARSKMAEVAAQHYRGARRKSAAELDKIEKLVILAVMLKLNTEIRNVFGKKLKSDRKEGKLPAVVYGKGKESKALFVNLNEFKKIWNKIEESTIVKLQGGSSDDVLVYDAEKDPVRGILSMWTFTLWMWTSPLRPM